MTPAGAMRMRLRGMVRKESLQILRDPSSIAIAFVMPLVLLLLFGYGVSLDAKHIRLRLVVEQPDTNTTSLTGAFQRSEFFIPLRYIPISSRPSRRVAHDVAGHRLAAQRFQATISSGSGRRAHRRFRQRRRCQPGTHHRGLCPGCLAGVVVELCALTRLANCRCRVTTRAPRIWFNAALRSRDLPRARPDRGDHDAHRLRC